jgi:hypothetical protein
MKKVYEGGVVEHCHCDDDVIVFLRMIILYY